MKNNIVSVHLWGVEICKLEWKGGYKNGFGKIGALVSFSPEYGSSGFDIDPLGPYRQSSYIVQHGLSDYFRAKENEGLPRFLGGSLPDDWGNRVFSLWIEKNGLRSHDITPVDKLAFIGKRGMGGFEFIPQLYKPESPDSIVLEELFELSKQIEQSRLEVSMNLENNPGIGELMTVGMSAGGQHPKAVIAIDWTTGEIRSGQVPLPESFRHYLLKFKNSEIWLSPEIEFVYYLMALECGIEMSASQLLKAGGVNHFLTERFDRKNGEKVHTATLHALAGEITSYEDIYSICRKLQLPHEDLEQLYRRMVFNYLGGVCDDHDKNFSFTLSQGSRWRLSPAYDETFTVDVRNRFRSDRHSMTIEQSDRGIGMKAFLRLAEENDIKDAKSIVNDIAGTLSSFNSKAQINGIDSTIADYISNYISQQVDLLG